MALKSRDYIGYSTSGIDDAVQKALEKAGAYKRVIIVETRSSQIANRERMYQATLCTLSD